MQKKKKLKDSLRPWSPGQSRPNRNIIQQRLLADLPCSAEVFTRKIALFEELGITPEKGYHIL